MAKRQASRSEPQGSAGHVPQAVRLPDDAAAAAAVDVVMQLRHAGHTAYLVGGCVRDLVLGLPPKDYDVATSARPDQVRRVFGKVIEVGAQFGVLRVPRFVGEERFELEVATFRVETGYVDGRRPGEVRFSDAREDVLRRDFTLNGLLLEPSAHPGESAQVIDWVGGIDDLREGLLRAIGEPLERFEEDHLRVMRLVRFAARFDLDVDTETMAAAWKVAGKLRRISRERIRDELVQMLLDPNAPAAIALLGRLRIERLLWKGLVGSNKPAAIARRFKSAQQLIADTPTSTGDYPMLGSIDTALALVLFFGPPTELSPRDYARAIGDDLRLPKPVARDIGAIIDLSQRILEGPQGADQIRVLRQELGDHALVAAAAFQPKSPHLAGLRETRASASRQQWAPIPIVTGATLKAAGYAPSPRFRIAIAAAETAQLDGLGDEEVRAAALAALQST